MSTDTMTPEAVQQTLQDYLRVATATGDLAGAHIEFSMDGVTWADVIVGAEHPAVARATVHRVGQVIPTVVTVLWDEVAPADENWMLLWLRKPHVLFGAFSLRTALRRAFADVLSDRREPDDAPVTPPAATDAPADAAAPAEDVDWHALVADAPTVAAVTEIRERARAARAVTIELRTALQRRMRDLDSAPTPADRWEAEPLPAKPEVWAAPGVAATTAPKPTPIVPLDARPRPTAVAEAFRAAQQRKAVRP